MFCDLEGDERQWRHSQRRLGLRRLESAARPALARFCAFFGRHLLPALGHPPSHPRAHIGRMRAANAKASEQNPAEKQQSERLPEANLPPSKQPRQKPIPEIPNELAAKVSE